MNFHPPGLKSCRFGEVALVRNPYPIVHSPLLLTVHIVVLTPGGICRRQQSQHHISLSRNFEFAMVLQWWKSFRNLACLPTASRFLFHQTGRGKLSSSSQRLYFGTKGKQNVYKPSRNLVPISSFSF